MQLVPQCYYHIYNRSNNAEIVFKSAENYQYFLEKYRLYFDESLETIAYCLMPTHFHFLVRIIAEDTEKIQKNIGVLLSSYTKAINKRYDRHGSLFQNHTKAKHVNDEEYLLTLAAYIHQNPVRAGLASTSEEWLYSSYQDYIGLRNGTLPNKQILNRYFSSEEEFRIFSDGIYRQCSATVLGIETEAGLSWTPP